MMSETPEEWLEQLFEFEFCAECGGEHDTSGWGVTNTPEHQGECT
jgi:hypothetical protein